MPRKKKQKINVLYVLHTYDKSHKNSTLKAPLAEQCKLQLQQFLIKEIDQNCRHV